MNFADWPVWALDADKKPSGNKLVPINQAVAELTQLVNQELEKPATKTRKKPGPKPKAKP